MDLPKLVVLKSNYNNKYMRYIKEEGEVHGFLQFTGDEVVSPYVMFKVEMAESGDGRRLVHIRCCYNNKYLARWSPNHWWIVAEADEPVENQSKWSCTLFEPLFVDDDDDAKTVLRFRHVQLNHYACLCRAAAPHTSCLFAGSKETDHDGCDVYTISDWESVIGHGGSVIQSEESCRCFSLPEMFIATNCFDDALVIGIGGFGKVYKGFIDNGATTVAIKRLNVESSQGAKEFWTEIKMLSMLRHTHLVALIGYCNGDKEMLLVYEYMANGTLADHLYKTSKKESGKSISHLTWEQRLNICIGAAHGLDYLHTGTDQSFIHRDVKTPNILLDENWVAKISDFGLSKAITRLTTTHVSTNIKGTFGYFDPDYFQSSILTRKADVYAFGVVLLEVICGRPPVDARLEEEQISLISWALECIEKGKLYRVIDPSLSGQITPQSLKHFVQLAKKCLHSRPKDRPTMVEVVASLEVALASQESSTVPFQAGKKILMDLPKFVVLKSNYNNKYMRYKKEEGEVHGFLQFTGDKVVSPYVMFKLEMAESGDGRLVHIRCCYNNKYLARWSPNNWWIVAEADGPEEDQSKWSCTLFEPLFVDDDDDAKTVLRFLHVQLNHYACLCRAAAPHTFYLLAGSQETDRDGCDVYTIIDWESGIGHGGGGIQSEESCRCFSLPEMFIATNCFDDALVIGIGRFGKVYKGFIDNDATTVAIKRLNVESNQDAKEFWTEIKMLSKLQHTHLVPLIGYCNDDKEMLLVYKYMANGTLADHLYKTSKKESGKSISHLTWEQRLNICIGAARGLDYLHTSTDQSFIHRYVKTPNILLDENWVAKISDFGLSKAITKHTTIHASTVNGTLGYFDLDYFLSHRQTKKSDVYAFGVVLFEVLCGRPPVLARLREEQIRLGWALEYIKKGKLDRVIDASLTGQITPQSLKYFVQLAKKCLRIHPKDRPTMVEVVASLEVALASQESRGRKQGIALMLKGMNCLRKGKDNCDQL